MLLLLLQLLHVAALPHAWGPAQPPPALEAEPIASQARADAKGVSKHRGNKDKQSYEESRQKRRMEVAAQSIR